MPIPFLSLAWEAFVAAVALTIAVYFIGHLLAWGNQHAHQLSLLLTQVFNAMGLGTLDKDPEVDTDGFFRERSPMRRPTF